MSVNDKDLLEIAERLVNQSYEIDWRASASRAYYSAFHSAQKSAQFCPDNGHLGMGSHERLSDRYKLHGTNKSKGISYVLQAMKKIRVAADYEIDDPFPKYLAEKQISQCKVLFDQLRSFEESNKTA